MVVFLIILQLFIIVGTGLFLYRKYRVYKYSMSFMESLNLVDLPIITFYYKDTKLNFLVDTGSNMSIINSTALKGEVLKTNKVFTSINGIGGSSKAISLELKIAYKDRVFETDFYSMNMDKAFSPIKEQNGVNVHGILGNDFFVKYKYIIDFEDYVVKYK